MKQLSMLAALTASSILIAGCGSGSDDADTHDEDGHTHADGTTHDDNEAAASMPQEEDQGHGEVALGSVTVDGMQIELAQGHGAVEPGKQGHLVIKLPYNDNGATIVRAWIGTDDATLSMVGLGVYAASHDDYDIHAVAPTPLPEQTMWWFEIEKPDGTKVVGSIKPGTE